MVEKTEAGHRRSRREAIGNKDYRFRSETLRWMSRKKERSKRSSDDNWFISKLRLVERIPKRHYPLLKPGRAVHLPNNIQPAYCSALVVAPRVRSTFDRILIVVIMLSFDRYSFVSVIRHFPSYSVASL